MSDRIVCSKCAVISRGFTGHCKHVVDLVEAMRERCARVAETEPELEGPMPQKVKEEVQKVSLEYLLRYTVRAAKKCIAKRIRAGD